MENQLPTQERLNNTYFKKKEDILKAIKDNINYIYIVLMIVANCLITLVRIEDGNIALNTPHSALGWLLWAIQIILQTVIGVMIISGFRRQGIKLGHIAINPIYQTYLSVIIKSADNTKPRSLKEYIKATTTKDSVSKAMYLVVISIFIGSATITTNLNGLLSLITNIIFAVGFGIKALLDAEEYVITELVIWYQLKIEELTDHKLEPSRKKKNDRKRNNNRNEYKLGSKEPSGVQQKEECSARSETIDTIESSKPIN